MDKNRSRFSKWLTPSRAPIKSLTRTKSVFTKSSDTTTVKLNNLSEKKKCLSLDRMEVDTNNECTEFQNFTNGKVIYSSLQPEIYASLDSSNSDLDNQSINSTVSFSQDITNIKKELNLRTNTVSRGFQILETIYLKSMEIFVANSDKCHIIDKVFKDLKCMSSFHQLYQAELNEIISNDLPLSMVFTNQVINSSLNWYKIFYTSFEARNQLLSSLYMQDYQFKVLADEAIIMHTKHNSQTHLTSLPWILSSIKDSLFHFEVLLARYSECLDDNLEKSRINDAIKLIQNILRSCNMQCDYNEFMKTQQEYNLLSTTEPLGPSVRFIHKGLVQKVCRQSASIRQRMIFLFTHMIFITNKSPQFHNYKIKHQLNLSICKFSIINSELKTSISRKGFRLECGEFSCEFLLDKETEFYFWIEKLNSTICQAKLRKNSFDRKITKYFSKIDDSEHLNVSIGVEEPCWQHENKTNFCNGFNCSTRFVVNQKPKHCSGDGLLYCENCVTYSTYLSYSNQNAPTCRECFEIITNHDNQDNPIERQLVKRKRIQRNGLIKGWLTINKISSSYIDAIESQHRMYCVLNSDCTIYTYELPEDKYHQLPIRVIQANFNSGKFNSCNSSFIVANISKNGFKYSIEADSEEEAFKWIQSIKLCQLENLHSSI